MKTFPLAPRDRTLERRLFGLLVLVQAAIYAWLILGRRLIRTHDTLFEYQIQYLFLAHACQNHDLAVWFPVSLHGVASNWFANFQGGLVQNVLLLVGGVPEGTNMVPVYYLGKFVEEFLLLLGAWRLAGHLYASPYARFFVGAAALGSSYWGSQFSFNFKVVYAVPLILSFVHDFLRDGRRGSVVLAGILTALQFTGSITYVPLLTGVALVTYLGLHAFLFRTAWAARFRDFRLRPADLALLLILGGVLASIAAVFGHGASAIRHYRPGRDADAGVTLDSFLTYAGTLSPGRYLDFFLGATPSLDYSLYCGAAVPLLALLALFAKPGRPVLHWTLCILLLLLFSTGFLGMVAAVAYEALPPLRFFRYVCLAAPLVKLFLIFLSGYGVQALAEGTIWKTALVDGILRTTLIVLAGSALILVFGVAGDDIPAILGVGGSGLANRNESSPNLPAALSVASTLLLGALFWLTRRGALSPGTCVVLLLGLETIDAFRWKVTLFREETVALDDAQYAAQRVRPLPFLVRRTPAEGAGDRFRLVKPLLAGYGAQYDLVEAFSHVDPLLSRNTILFWMPPFESLVQALNGLPPGRKLEGLPAFRNSAKGDSASKILGFTADKLQVFREAYAPGSDEAVAGLLTRPEFKGDLLLLSPGPGLSTRPPPSGSLATSDRLDAVPQVLHFDMNELRLAVEIPAGPQGAWLFYGDVWDPGWTATVNGRPAAVERAFLAYKAVRLEPGKNEVLFRFEAPLRIWCYRAVGLASAVFLGWAAVLTLSFLGALPARQPGAPPADFRSTPPSRSGGWE